MPDRAFIPFTSDRPSGGYQPVGSLDVTSPPSSGTAVTSVEVINILEQLHAEILHKNKGYFQELDNWRQRSMEQAAVTWVG